MTTLKSAVPRAVADVAAGTILASVEIAVPPQRVFEALSSSEITKWWGSAELYRTTEWVGDLKPGGKWKSTGVGADGKPFSVGGEFVEVDPPRKLVHTWKPDWDPGSATTVTYLLRSIEGGTQVTIRHEGFGSNADSCRGHAEGWERVFGWLSAHLSPPSKVHYLCRLLPPRPTFMLDMSPEEMNVMKAHAAYWAGHLESGAALLYGPVADPNGGWGVGIIAVDSEAKAAELEANDPTMKSGRGFRYERFPMPRLLR